ncbi:MAG: leucine--tRNA ligase [Candidatus Micrarchaeota archaeon]|nr:leucine--tRNA ligase [Candidatus Micrarchaeota archaeon]
MHDLDVKWQGKWAEKRVFEPQAGAIESSPATTARHLQRQVTTAQKFYLTAAFPYPNSPQHIGHGRTYTTTDIYARYQRMRGKSVLFPMGFHVTGTPILAMAKRIGEKDEEILSIFENIYGIPRAVSATLTDPRDLVAYFSREIEAGMREMGYSIDWRRKFYSFDAQFNRFIEWHFAKLEQAGYITKGEHPVPWCPVGQTAIGAHDTKGDLDPQIEEVTGVLFPYDDGALICSTYRPETIYGVTNIWMNPDAVYLKVKNEKDGKAYYISKDVFTALSMQLPFSIVEEVSAQKMMEKKAKNPITGEELPIFPATFVDPKHGTGVVMSVPAHAPLDYLALRDAGLDGRIKLKQVLALSGFGAFPAKEIVERMGIKSQSDTRAEEATAEIYKKEAHTGVMMAGEFAGMKGMEAKEKIRAKMIADGSALALYEISNSPIYSRYGGLVGVKIVRDQWFIDYGDEAWKAQARECLAGMSILPQKTRHEYEYIISWLRQKACTRSAGLGTAFPLDRTKMIEALSDSTIYMAFYTISHIAMKMKPEELSEKLFDYVFLGKGSSAGLPKEAEEMRREFSYWYPLDSRHSATDLVHNHLTFLIFNHVAIFPREMWPRQIVTNGFVLMDGKKMSKSMGNIIPIRAAVKQFGADAIRFVVVSGADLSSDTDFNRPAVEGVISRLKFMKEAMAKYASILPAVEPEGSTPMEKFARNFPAVESRDSTPMEKHASAADGKGMAQGKKAGAGKSAAMENRDDIAGRWLLSRMHKRAIAAPSMYENFQLRELSLELLYNTFNDLQWCLKRASKPQLREFFEMWVPLVAPIVPHYAEEMWEALGKKQYVKDAPFVALAELPKGDEKKVDERLEAAEDYILRAREDISSILKLIKKDKPAKVELFVAAEWKRKLRAIAAREKKFDVAMKAAMADAEIKPHAAQVAKVLQNYMKNIGALGETPTAEFEMGALLSGKKLLEDELGCPVSAVLEEESAVPKAAFALPGKPSIMIS